MCPPLASRGRALKAAQKIGDNIASEVIALLESDRKDVRQAAAAALSGFDYAEWEDEIQSALEREEHPDVAFGLEDLLDGI